MTIFNKILKTKEFEKDFKKLLKRFKTLEKDLHDFIQIALKIFHKQGIDNGGIVRITQTNSENPMIYKARKFACKALKGKGARSGIRIIYSHCSEQDKIEFIEMYYKGDKEIEDKGRIEEYGGGII
ncbi:hypothetical protein ACFL4A_04070 [bacterium]